MAKNRLIIIIGLPGSGKTYIMNKLNNFIIFDDFIQSFYDGNLIDLIKAGNKVCITDPRLCLPNIFNIYIKKILKYITIKQIFIILFENNPKQCLINIKHRNDNRRLVADTIINYSKYYNLTHYINFRHKILPVYAKK